IEHGKNMADSKSAQSIRDALNRRFGETLPVDDNLPAPPELARLPGRRVQRRTTPRAVEPELLRLLCACALSAPSKSDLQQADILILRDRANQRAIARLITDMPWIPGAPAFLVFLADGRGVPHVAQARGKPFPNDHLDLFFNAAVDSALVLA